MSRAFPLEILRFIKKNIKVPLLKNIDFAFNNNRTASVFMLE